MLKRQGCWRGSGLGSYPPGVCLRLRPLSSLRASSEGRRPKAVFSSDECEGAASDLGGPRPNLARKGWSFVVSFLVGGRTAGEDVKVTLLQTITCRVRWQASPGTLPGALGGREGAPSYDRCPVCMLVGRFLSGLCSRIYPVSCRPYRKKRQDLGKSTF